MSASLFSPREAEAQRRAEASAARVTPGSCGNRPGTHRAKRPQRQPRDHYTVDSYRRAIERACDEAFPLPEPLGRGTVGTRKNGRAARAESVAEWKTRLGPGKWTEVLAWRKAHRWSPNRLRHNAATALRQEFGIDVAQTVLGHQLGSKVTEIYAAANLQKAVEAIRRVG